MEHPLTIEHIDVFSRPVSFVVPDLLVTAGATPDDLPELTIFMTGFAVLTVAYKDGSFIFDETVRVSEEYTDSIRLLDQLISAIPDGACVGALNVQKLVSSLVRVPRGDAEDHKAKAPLERLVHLLDRVPEDLVDYDREAGRSMLDSIGLAHGLEPEWSNPNRQRNPIANGRRLSSRVQTLFLAAVGKHCSDPAARSAASADLQAWRETGRSIA
jgi:hypothetical protein